MHTGKVTEQIKRDSERIAIDPYYFKLLEFVKSRFPAASRPLLVLDEIRDQNSTLFRLIVDLYILEVEIETEDSLGNLIQFDITEIRSYYRSSCRAGRQKIEAARKILRSWDTFPN